MPLPTLWQSDLGMIYLLNALILRLLLFSFCVCSLMISSTSTPNPTSYNFPSSSNKMGSALAQNSLQSSTSPVGSPKCIADSGTSAPWMPKISGCLSRTGAESGMEDMSSTIVEIIIAIARRARPISEVGETGAVLNA